VVRGGVLVAGGEAVEPPLGGEAVAPEEARGGEL
jgi:hypothetical protein